jgi:2-polyprenyl-6-hydroxyphenyl methylase/3-demethylubiquinone-9 3-methyltransferase
VYRYTDNEATWGSAYLWPKVLPLIPPRSRVFEIGCGNGALTRKLRELGHDAIGVDASESGIAMAGPHCFLGSAYDDLAAQYGRFPVVVSLEVVEHLLEPRRFARAALDLLEPGGTAVISTPFHGYWKNLALALANKMDAHFTALWDGGHIKFWSERTLGTLLSEAGFVDVQFSRVGRIPPIAKSMIAVARKPLA